MSEYDSIVRPPADKCQCFSADVLISRINQGADTDIAGLRIVRIMRSRRRPANVIRARRATTHSAFQHAW